MKRDFVKIGELFDKYTVQMPMGDQCIIITGLNGSCKTKTLELVRDYKVNLGENVVYFECDRILDITIEDAKEALDLLESYSVLNKIMDEPHDMEFFKKWNLKLDMLEMDLKWQYGQYISSGFVQLVNFITKIIKAGPNAIVMIDMPERSLHPVVRRTFLSDLLNLPNVEQLIVVTHCPELIENLEENTWDIKKFLKIKENVI